MIADAKYFDLGGVTITVTRYGYNRIDVSRYICHITSDKNKYTFEYGTNGYVHCNSLDEAKQYINKIRHDYLYYKELEKKLSISCDFT